MLLSSSSLFIMCPLRVYMNSVSYILPLILIITYYNYNIILQYNYNCYNYNIHILQSVVYSYKLCIMSTIECDSDRGRARANVRERESATAFKNYLLFSITVLIYKPYPSKWLPFPFSFLLSFFLHICFVPSFHSVILSHSFL